MAVDQIKKLQAAEALLKQGRADEALTELQRLAESSPNDLLTLNRMGDMLSRQGRVDDALGYYGEIADKFAAAGYLHKAVAILKKMLRLAPESTDVLAKIGRLYIRQKLPVEGGRYLLSAADRFLEAKEFASARAVYEELVVTDPQNPLHRARLAETMAAEGDADAAGRELIRLADSLRSEGRWEDAERSYRRAGELCPDWNDPILGVSACLKEDGKLEEALDVLETAVADGRKALTAELILRSEMAGRSDRVDALMQAENGLNVPNETFEHLFVQGLESGDVVALWTRLDPILVRWPDAGATDRLVELYESVVGIEDGGHTPALERLFTVLESSSDRQAFVPAMERLFRGLRQRSMDRRATTVEGWIREFAPKSAVLVATPLFDSPRAGDAASSTPASPGLPEEASNAEAPPVPLNRADQEFVTGRLTQAEILEKYSLVEQAVQQVRDVATRFPGHVDAQKRLVKLLRQSGDVGGHAYALAGLAIACRAAGNLQAARNSAAEALGTGLLNETVTATLERLGLRSEEAASAKAEPAKAKSKTAKASKSSKSKSKKSTKVAKADPVKAAEAPPADAPVIELSDSAGDPSVVGTSLADTDRTDAAPEAKQAAQAKTDTPTKPEKAKKVEAKPEVEELVVDLDADEEVVIDLDSDESVAEVMAAATEAASKDDASTAAAAGTSADGEATKASESRAPGEELLEEVAFYLGQERVEEARQRIDTLHELGYTSPRLEELSIEVAKLESDLSAMPVPDSPATASQDADADAFAAGFDIEDDDDLSTIAAALESELDDESQTVEPDAGHEQSVADVFSAFREKVNEEIDSDDFRTHYDLGIGYKEMGLLEEALGEFEISLQAPELEHESQVMMGLILRELGRLDEALVAYRSAVAESDPAQTVPLRYDLADLLQQAGDPGGALEVLREVLEVDPGFRDVQDRVASLEAALPAPQG